MTEAQVRLSLSCGVSFDFAAATQIAILSIAAKSDGKPIERVVGSIMRSDLSLHVHVRVGKVEHDYAAIVAAVSRVTPRQIVVICAATFSLMRDVVEYLCSHRDTRDRMADRDAVAGFHGMVDKAEKERAFALGDRLRLLVTNGAFSHGVDLRADDIVVFVIGSFDSKAMILQALGRASRSGSGAVVHLIVRDGDLTRRAKALREEAVAIRECARVELAAPRALQCEQAANELVVLRDNISAFQFVVRSVCFLTSPRADKAACGSTTVCLLAALCDGFVLREPIVLNECHHNAPCTVTVVNRRKPKAAVDTSADLLERLLAVRTQLTDESPTLCLDEELVRW